MTISWGCHERVAIESDCEQAMIEHWQDGVMRKAEQYKPIGEGRASPEEGRGAAGEGSGKQAIDALRQEVLSPIERDMEKLRDPFVLAAIMNNAANERENTNRLLKTIIERLDSKFAEMEERLSALEAAQGMPAAPPGEEVLLPSVDEEIVRFVGEKRHASAEEVRARFNYKGKNAASARLNRLYEMGLLGKKQVGRAVLFFARK